MQQPHSHAAGRVLQVNVSEGGVPKLPVVSAWVGPLGLEGDRHREFTVHGGPHKAVCLYGIEAIERLRSEGHPIEPGSAGENLTTAGVDWSTLPVGTRVRVGPTLEIELSSAASPCSTQRRNFSDGRFSRISIDLHPTDSRMYARVIRDGEVRPGDSIVIAPPGPDSEAQDFLVLKQLERAERKSSVAAWRAAEDAGFAVALVEDGDLAMSSSHELPGPAFNQATGLSQYPNLLDVVTRFYDERGTNGYLWMAEEPWPNAVVTLHLGFFGAAPEDVADVAPPPGVVVRRIGAGEVAAYTSVNGLTGGTVRGVSDGTPDPWPAVYEQLARNNSRHLFIAELDGKPVGNGSLHIGARTGWLRGALVAPEARGRGIQKALIAARVRAAAEAGCHLVGASAEPDEVSARNLERMGFRALGRRSSYEYVPGSRG
jgi:MOSC domain-containing protein YiiM/GNAT superfamily N-acetyltransferase